MPKLPVVNGRKLVEFFKKQGFRKDRQTASHIILEKEGVKRPVVIPNHRKVSVAVILRNLKTASISRKDFIAALQKRKK